MKADRCGTGQWTRPDPGQVALQALTHRTQLEVVVNHFTGLVANQPDSGQVINHTHSI